MMHIRMNTIITEIIAERLRNLFISLASIPMVLYSIWVMKKTIKEFLKNRKEVK